MKKLSLCLILLALYACDSDASVRQINSPIDMQANADMDPIDSQMQIIRNDQAIDLTLIDQSTLDMNENSNDDQSLEDMDGNGDIDQSLEDMDGNGDDQSLEDMDGNGDIDQSLEDMDGNGDIDQSLEDMNGQVDVDQSMNMGNANPRIIHFKANLVQGAVKQSNANFIMYGTVSSGATLSHSDNYHVRAIINP